MRRNRTGFGERVLSFHGVALPQFRCGGPAVVRRRPVPRMYSTSKCGYFYKDQNLLVIREWRVAIPSQNIRMHNLVSILIMMLKLETKDIHANSNLYSILIYDRKRLNSQLIGFLLSCLYVPL